MADVAAAAAAGAAGPVRLAKQPVMIPTAASAPHTPASMPEWQLACPPMAAVSPAAAATAAVLVQLAELAPAPFMPASMPEGQLSGLPMAAVTLATASAAAKPVEPLKLPLLTPAATAAFVLPPAMPEGQPLAASAVNRGDQRTPTPAPAFPPPPQMLKPKTLNEAALARVVRCIIRAGPPIIDKKNKTATPALAVPYFASKMAFLAGAMPGGALEGIHAAALEVFSSSMNGWLWLCRLCGVCDRGLFLVGRILPEHQFVGQPSSINCTDLVNCFNPSGGPMWTSRRFSMRHELDLWDVDLSGPGSPSVEDLAMVREVLRTEDGKKLATAAGCSVMAGTAGRGGGSTTASKLVFDWSAPWVPGSAAAALVHAVEQQAGFLKPPYNDLVTVKKWPVVYPPPSSAPASAAGLSRKRRAAGGRAAAAERADLLSSSDEDSPRAPSRAETGERPAQRPRNRGGRSGKIKVSTRNAVEAAASFVPAPSAPLTDLQGCILTTIYPCAAWPRGGWAAQIPLAAFLDLSAVGKVCLSVSVLPQPGPPDGSVVVCDGGIYSYRLVVIQTRIEATDETRALAKFVRAADGVSDRCQSIDMLKGVRRAAEKKLHKEAAKSRTAEAAKKAMSVLRATQFGATAMDPSTQSVGDASDGDAGDAGGATGGNLRASEAVAQTMDAMVSAADAVGFHADADLAGIKSMDIEVATPATADVMDLVGTAGHDAPLSGSSVDGSDVRMRVVFGLSPPVAPHSFSFSFSSDYLLHRRVTHVRDGGRLWVVADVKEEVRESSGSDA